MSSKEPRGLARHFTSRRTKSKSGSVSEGSRGRAASLSIRSKISGPVQLIHTTNMLSYNAPNISPRTASSTTTKTDSDSESVPSPTPPLSNASSPPTSPDVADMPRTKSPEPNHLSCYFLPPNQGVTPAKPSPVPVVPHRAASHTKKNSEIMVRKRSMSRFSENSAGTLSAKASFSFSRSSSTTAGSHASTPSTGSTKVPVFSSLPVSPNPIDSAKFSPLPSPLPTPIASPAQRSVPFQQNMDAVAETPFGQELEKVSEIAEDYGVKDKVEEGVEDKRYMSERGLSQYKAEDYVSEIQGLISSLLAEVSPQPAAVAPGPMWI